MAVQTISVTTALAAPTAAVTLDEDASTLAISGTSFSQRFAVEISDDGTNFAQLQVDDAVEHIDRRAGAYAVSIKSGWQVRISPAELSPSVTPNFRLAIQ